MPVCCQQTGIVGWSKTMIEKQRVQDLSNAWEWQDFTSRDAASHGQARTRDNWHRENMDVRTAALFFFFFYY